MWTWEVNRRTLHAFLAWNEIDYCRSQEAQLTLNMMSRENLNEKFPFKSINRLISILKREYKKTIYYPNWFFRE